MNRNEEIKLHRKMGIDTTHRFDFKKCWAVWLSEHYKVFRKPVNSKIKKSFRKVKVLFINDEHLLFRVLANDFLNEEYQCPKCEKRGGFIPTRYKRLEKMLTTKKPVYVEPPRTLSCMNCSFTFNPLVSGFYANTKIDLRKWFFYMCIAENDKNKEVDYPVTSIARILDVSYNTAKNIKNGYDTGDRRPDDYAEKFVNNKSEDHPLMKLMAQMADFKYG